VKLRIVTAAIGERASCALPAAAAVDRARVDALEVHTGIAHTYHGEAVGVMHACGHDSYTVMLMGIVTQAPGHARDTSGNAR
jgi:metal-dependent amidase/aminoacylase/carboxypeptidase family protein